MIHRHFGHKLGKTMYMMVEHIGGVETVAGVVLEHVGAELLVSEGLQQGGDLVLVAAVALGGGIVVEEEVVAVEPVCGLAGLFVGVVALRGAVDLHCGAFALG